MKLATPLRPAILAAAILLPALCMAQDAPPPPDGEQQHQRRGQGQGGPGRPGGDIQLPREVFKMVQEYKENPSPELKAKIKAKIVEAFEQRIKEIKERLDKFQAEKEKNIDKKLEHLLSARHDGPPDGQGQGEKGRGKGKPKAKPADND